jgi:hypothetical protein
LYVRRINVGRGKWLRLAVRYDEKLHARRISMAAINYYESLGIDTSFPS